MSTAPVLRAVDAVTVPVPTLDEGIAFYGRLGHHVLWRDEATGTAGLALPDTETELVLSTRHRHEPDWLVDSVPDAVEAICSAGGSVVAAPSEIPVGRVAVVADALGNPLVLVDLSKGRYRPNGSVGP